MVALCVLFIVDFQVHSISLQFGMGYKTSSLLIRRVCFQVDFHISGILGCFYIFSPLFRWGGGVFTCSFVQYLAFIPMSLFL